MTIETVDFPINSMVDGSFHSYVSLPEGHGWFIMENTMKMDENWG